MQARSPSPLLLEQAVHVLLRVKRDEIVDALAHAGIANRQLEIVRDGDRHAALRRAVEFRQHDRR